uniref:Uncharacterized protein n=2 Tax=Micromonas pusilla TaxID=38833 RepID=A0A7S0KLH9_MICPS|mmetsp:Transcript_15989/g.62227  ORF Transcript_15989/g.62227 Transcript_15989/m.62227 type:complete len:554 (+) Transcript_15989:300-1961(+)
MLLIPKQRRTPAASSARKESSPLEEGAPRTSSPDENADAGNAGTSPAVKGPPPKRARSAAAPVKSFDGAKNFIAQLQASDADPKPKARANTSSRKAPGSGDASQNRGGPAGGSNRLDELEEDAMHALSDLLSQDPEDSFALGGSDAGTAPTVLAARAPKRVRSNVVAKPGGAKARRTSAGGSAGGAARGGKQQSGSDSGSQGTTTQAVNAQQQLDGPSASRKAADHRRLLKSYMKALFRHLKLPVEYKSAASATYRDRINNALAYWFGDSFAPGKTTRECHAPKVVCCLVRIATSGRVVIRPEDVSEILVKGLQAKNANYAVSAAALRKHKIADAELRAMFDGETREMDGWPRGLPLNLPDRDEALPDFDSKGAKVAAALSPVKEEPNPAEADEGVGQIDDTIKPRAAVKGARSKRGGGAKRPDVTGTPAPPAAVKTHGATVVGDSPLFSPVGHVAAAFAAAALMPEPLDRSEAAREFTRSMVDPLIASVRAQADPATRMEMINCAQGELARLATEMAREHHEASRAALAAAEANQPYSPPDAASPSRPSKRR